MIDLKVWGEYACFTRPEFKVERVSYPVMTPSAARGVLEAIYWKPQIRYRIQRIGVLEQGTQLALLRNEISGRQSERSEYLVADDSSQRSQRTSLVVEGRWHNGQYRPVAYRICARVALRDGETNIGKHLDSFRRRAKDGQYFHKPYLGCREFPADFEPSDEKRDQPDPNLTFPIGTMLFDTAYVEDPTWYKDHDEDHLEFWRHSGDDARVAKGYAKRLTFNAAVEKGWLIVPQEKYDELEQLEARHGTA
jgi:CRISPR-associated protein Cas5d